MACLLSISSHPRILLLLLLRLCIVTKHKCLGGLSFLSRIPSATKECVDHHRRNLKLKQQAPEGGPHLMLIRPLRRSPLPLRSDNTQKWMCRGTLCSNWTPHLRLNRGRSRWSLGRRGVTFSREGFALFTRNIGCVVYCGVKHCLSKGKSKVSFRARNPVWWCTQSLPQVLGGRT